MDNEATPLVGDLREMLGQLSRQLDRMDRMNGHATPASQPAPQPAPTGSDTDLVRLIVAARRSREGHIPVEMVGEPAWDILLDLYLAEADGRMAYSASCCAAAGVPHTTGLRYIKRLVSLGLVKERSDPSDTRRTLIALTPKGQDALTGWVQQWRRSRWFAALNC